MEVKSAGTFPVILVKLATPPLPPHTMLNKLGGNESFLGPKITGDSGGIKGWTQNR